jgi:hypothetical protein
MDGMHLRNTSGIHEGTLDGRNFRNPHGTLEFMMRDY